MNLPERFFRAHQTVCINPLLTEGANILQHVIPFFHEEARLSLKENAPEQEISRLAYELLAAEYSGYEPTVCSMDFIVPAPHHYNIPVRFYKRHHGVDFSYVVLYIHGGGWTRGNFKTHDTLCRRICKTLSFPLVSIHYRTAPEYAYPEPLDDVERVYHFIHQHRSLLGFHENTQFIIMGDSAGGNLSLGLTLRLLQKSPERLPKALGLFYPALDLRIPDMTRNPYAVGYTLSRDLVNECIINYIGTDQEKQTVTEVSPLLCSDEILNNLPPITIVSAECDVLTEESSLFIDRLKGMNKPCAHSIVPSVIHSFSQFFDLFPEAQQSVDFMGQSILDFLCCQKNNTPLDPTQKETPTNETNGPLSQEDVKMAEPSN